jgi:hypothetical protein
MQALPASGIPETGANTHNTKQVANSVMIRTGEPLAPDIDLSHFLYGTPA